jgi:hypothetical protein
MKSRSRAALRTASDLVAALDGRPAGPAPQVPDLLARAEAAVRANPALAAWEDGESVIVEGTGYRLRRVYRDYGLPSSHVDLVVLYNPDRDVPAFPVATLVGTQYRPMTDVAGFRQWQAIYGGGAR